MGDPDNAGPCPWVTGDVDILILTHPWNSAEELGSQRGGKERDGIGLPTCQPFPLPQETASWRAVFPSS